MKVYLIGSLRNPEIPILGERIRRLVQCEVFDDWYAAGETADDAWRDYERQRGRDLPAALKGYAAQHVFRYDTDHLTSSSDMVLVLPAGKSGHLEFGWGLGCGKYGIILLDKTPDRYDVMYSFADYVTMHADDMIRKLQERKACLA